MIDVLFLLLIFFIVATRFSKEEAELELELPSASQSLPLTQQPTQLIINIDAGGRFYVNGQFRQPEELEKLLRQSVADNPLTQSVAVRYDKKTQGEFITTAFDICKKAGVSNFDVMTESN